MLCTVANSESRRMFEEVPDPTSIRSRILRKVFPRLDFDDATTLVGILFEYRIVFSRQFWTLLRPQKIKVDLDPFEPQAAAVFVADVFSHDCDRLYVAYHRRWAALRDTPRVKGLIAKIEAHEFVDHLQRWAPGD